MRLIIRLLFLVLCFVIPRFGWGEGSTSSPPAETSLCGNANISSKFNFIGSVVRALNDISQSTNLDKYLSSDGSKYLLCFGMTEPMPMSRTLLLQNNTTKPVAISGLNIAGDIGIDILLKLSGSSPIILEKSNLGKCSHCIVADGKGVQINGNVSVQCNGSGIGITLLGEGQQVTNTQIADCDTGIQVGNESVAVHNVRVGPENASEYEKNKVQFLRNKISINVVNGTDNYFHHNNFENAQALYGPRNNVYIKNASEKLNPPKILPKTGSENAVDFLNYPDNLTALPKDNSEVTATIRILSDAKEGGLEVLISSASGYDFYKDAKFISSQQNGDQYLLTYEMPMTLKQFCQTAVVLFHHPGLGTTDNSPVLYLNGPYKGKTDGGTSCLRGGPGVLPAPSQNDPGVVSGPTLTSVPAVVSEPALTSAAPVVDNAIADNTNDPVKKKEPQNAIVASNATPVSSSDAAQSGGDVVTSNMGGLGGGCTLNRYQNNNNSVPFVLLFSFPILCLAAMKSAKRIRK